jgi:dihydroorotase
VQHISSGGTVEILRRARGIGANAALITGEASPHHLTLTDDSCAALDTNSKMNPPLREESDVAALRQGVADGVVTVLGTDHAPHSLDEKHDDFQHAPFGILGLETALPLYAEALVRSGAIDWPRLIALLTINPARLCGLDTRGLGILKTGGPGDITVIDPDHQWRYDVAQSASKSRNSPFNGWLLTGASILTIAGGTVRASLVGSERTKRS